MNIALPAKSAPAASSRRKSPWSLANIGFSSLAAALSILMLLPLFWMLSTALKANNDIYRIPPQFFPTEFQFSNFAAGIETIGFWSLFANTTIIAAISTVAKVFSSMLVGYGLSRIRFPGRRIWFYLFIGSMMMPGVVGMIPTFQVYLRLGWYNTWWPLIFPAFFGDPFFIFLARQYFMSVPLNIDEAAKIDGAGHWAIFTQLMLPLTRPLWITMAIIAFQASWNDYLNPLIYLYSQDKWTLSLGMASFSGAFAGVAATQWNQFMATNLLYMLPPLIVFFVAQRHFMAGLGSLGSTAREH
jgi:multiple sugar transport system permease protein